MFEHIHFDTLKFDSPLTSSSSEKDTAQKVQPIFRYLDDYHTYFDEYEMEAQFSITGDFKLIFPRPISEFAQKNLLHLQVFSLINAGKTFFTTRKEYPSYLLLYTYDGHGTLHYNNQEHTLSKGTGFLIDCRQPHYYATTSSHWNHSILHFNGNTAKWIYEQFLNCGGPLFNTLINGSYQYNLEQLLLAYQDISPHREFEISTLLSLLLLNILKENTKKGSTVPEYIKYLQKYMESNYTRALSVSDLASFANMSKYHLDREFKRYTGYSLNAYLIELRISRAKFYLSNTPLSVSQVSMLSGFSNYANFLKLFKNRTGYTPSAFREGRNV